MIHESISAVSMEQLQPISRTYQYRKVMKPMLERKRRARINRCLDELKELMVSALQSEGENVSKLEKADILELTVRHLHKLRRQERLSANPVIDADRYRAGFTQCAAEVSHCLANTPGVDVQLGTKLMTHLGHRLNNMDKMTPLSVQIGLNASRASPAQTSTSTGSETSSVSGGGGAYYVMPLTPASSTASCGRATPASSVDGFTGLLKVSDNKVEAEVVWRPW